METIIESGLPARAPGMSDAQYTYAQALALYQTQRARFLAEEIPEAEVSESLALLLRAEDELIRWADRAMRRSLGRQRFRQIQTVFQSRMRPGMKQRLVDICFKFRDAGSGGVTGQT